jgi:hypothetical protein
MLTDPIYVWPVLLGDAAAWEGLLSPDERATATQFRRSNGLALIVIASAGSLGVDVEYVRGDLDVDALAAEYLAPGIAPR